MMSRSTHIALMAALVLAAGLASAQQGDVRRVHDPCIIKAGDVYYLFCTGNGIPIRRSKDLVNWERAGSVFRENPAWVREAIPGVRGLWAPDISFFNDKYHLYYAASTFGSNRSAIGLATNVALDPASPQYKWVDEGKVIETTQKDNWNAIDANIILDERNQPWMAIGSFWSGIKLLPIYAPTGKLPASGAPILNLAARPRPGAVEAPFMIRRGGYYYLFVSFDFCARGVDSTYRIMVGRSKQLAGPFLDKDAKPMLDGGGTQVLATHGHVRGPGHNAIFEEGGKHWLVHHYYDARERGIPTLQIRPITWNDAGWPVAGEPVAEPAAATPAREAEAAPGLHPLHAETAFYPRGLELADGTQLVTFDHPTPGGRAVGCIRSTDRGKTWGDYQRIAEDAGAVDVANAFPWQLADGTLLAAYRRHTPDQRIYQLELAASADNGRTWQLRNTIVTGSVGLWEPFLFEPSKGVLQVYYASEEGIYPDQRIEMKTSMDGGKTWGPPATVARKPGSRDGMPSVVRAGDGAVLMCFEASDLPPFRFVVRTVRSTDDGATWSAERTLVYRPANSAAQRWAAGAPYLVRLKNGRLMVSLQTDEDVLYQQGDSRADPALSAYRYERHTRLKMVASDDHGASWSAPVTIAGETASPATWGSLLPLRNGEVVALMTCNRRIWSRYALSPTPTRPYNAIP